MSMSELLAQKRKQAEEALAGKIKNEMIKGKPSEEQVAERKAKLLAQRDALRQQKQAKREEQLDTFNQKTETKEDLFNELKKMDAEVDEKRKKEAAAKRLEMMRKARADVESDNKREAEAIIQKKNNTNKKPDTNTGGGNDDWFDNLKTFGTQD